MHNKCDEVWGFIFVQSELKGFEEWRIQYLDELTQELKYCGATEWASKVKQQLERKDALGIVKIKVFTDLSKEETLETVRSIKEETIAYTEKNNCGLGLVISTIGFALDKMR